MKRQRWGVVLLLVALLLSGCDERARMVREAQRNTPPTVVAGGR